MCDKPDLRWDRDLSELCDMRRLRDLPGWRDLRWIAHLRCDRSDLPERTQLQWPGDLSGYCNLHYRPNVRWLGHLSGGADLQS